MADPVDVQVLGRECRRHRLSSCPVFPEDVADAEAGEAGATTITEDWIVGRRRATTFGQERTKEFGGLRP